MTEFIGKSNEVRSYQGRFTLFKAGFVACFLILFVRVWYLQILNGARFYTYSKENSLKQEKIPAPRGIIYDRNREILVDSLPSFDITWTPQFVTQPNQATTLLSALLGIPSDDIRNRLKKASHLPPFQPRVIKKNVTRDEVAKIDARLFDMPGIDVTVEIRRYYPDAVVGAHLYGYLGEINEQELETLNRRSFEKYHLGDVVGKSGVEERWEDYLRGIDGAVYAEVDAYGRKKKTGLGLFGLDQKRREPIAGKNLVLTIDRDLQHAAAKALRDKEGRPKAGGVVALDPNSGEILAMLSQPGFDPTEFSRGVDAKLWQALKMDEEKPLLDKTIQDAYPPGSAFKLITALAGLETRAIDPQEEVTCNGFYRLGRARYRCWTWRKGGHGAVDLQRAIKESCDTYFYRLGVKVGVNQIAKYAKMFGLGRKSGLNLRGEVKGVVPSTRWKEKHFGERWYPGETPPVAIGQGALTLTVLQLARLYAALANGGTLYVPFVVKRSEEPGGALIQAFHPQRVKTAKLDNETWRRLKEGFYAVVNEPGGTGYYSARADGYDIAGKTGTAQVVRFSKKEDAKKCEEVERKYRDHGWFVGFAPVDQPKIVVAAFGLHDCHSYSGAAQAVRDVIKSYLKDRIDPRVIRPKPKPKAIKTKKEGEDA